MRRRRAWIAALAALVAVGAAASPTRADGERERPWPEAWPIVLPPIEGPLPPAPPPAPPVAPATHAARRVVDELDRIGRTMRRTRYQHWRRVEERSGTYYWDCSLMTEWVLRRAAPRSVHHLRDLRRPLAEHFVRTIERAPTEGWRRGWRRIAHIEEVKPGDVFAWRRPRGFPSRNSGHVGFVRSAPRRVDRIPGAYAVDIADATRGGHQNDSRPWPGEGGFGTGTIVFLTDDRGRGTHYGWAGTRSEGYVVTPILFGRVGP